MNTRNPLWRFRRSNALTAAVLAAVAFVGCAGYRNESLFPSEIGSVYVEMFENRTFWRDIEFDVTDAVSKRIEAQTPYKVVSSRDRADSVITGQIVAVDQGIITRERQTGVALERQVQLRAVVTWKNLSTGDLLVDAKSVSASGSYSTLQQQGFGYAAGIAANNLAQRVVELMEKPW